MQDQYRAEDVERIVIVGAGPVGLVSAMLLSAQGIPVLLLEAQSRVSDDLRASTFHPPTLDMLADSGIAAKLIEHGLICPTWQIRMHATGDKALFDLSLIADATDHPYRLQCEQATLCELLAQRLTDDEGVTIAFNSTVTQIEQTDDSVQVTVRSTLDPTEQTQQTLSARYVVGADGAGSIVRESMGLKFDGMTYAETTVLVSTPFAFHQHIDDLSNVNYCWSPGGNFALLRLKEFWRCSLYYDPGLSFDEAVSEERVQAQLNEIYPASQPYRIIDKRPYRVHQRLVSDYRVGRVLLAGDAAHVNSPSGGMGMNGGIHDAFNLVEKLSAVWQGADSSYLDQYTQQRRPVVESAIMAQADRNRKRMTEKNPAARARSLSELQALAGDKKRARAYLLKTSMIDGSRH